MQVISALLFNGADKVFGTPTTGSNGRRDWTSTMGATTGLLGGIIATILLKWLSSRAAPYATNRGNRKVLAYGPPVRILGWLMLVFGGFVAYVASQCSSDQRVIAWIVGLSMGVIGLYIWLEFQFVRIEFDDHAIYTFSPWRRRRAIPWREVTGYHFSELNQWHVIQTSRHGRVRLSSLLSGLFCFFDALKKQKAWPPITLSGHASRFSDPPAR